MKHFTLMLIAIAAISLAAGCRGGSESRFQIGERAMVDDWPDVIALEFQRDIERRDLYDEDTIFDVEPAEPDEEVVLVKIRLLNDEDEPFVIDPWLMFGLRSQGKEIDPTYELSADRVMEEQAIAPAGELEGNLAYTVVRGLRDFELVYQPEAAEAFEQLFERISEGDFSSRDLTAAVISLE